MPPRIMTGGYDTDGPDDEDAAAFRDALAHWATGVTIVAARHDGRIYALTATAFTAVSLDPPLVSVALGAGAAALPFLQEGHPFAISILAESQRSLATSYADSFPVGPNPFPAEGPPLVHDALARLTCTVHSVLQAGDHHMVLGTVDEASSSPDGRPLVYYQRDYRSIEP